MDFRFSPEEEAYRQQVGQFLDRELTQDIKQEVEIRGLPGPLYHRFMGRVGAQGWLSQTWPPEYGGLGRSPIYHFILVEEMARRGVEYRNIGQAIVAPIVMFSGSPELKQEFLPKITRGEISFSLFYSEPHSGSDLASLELRAQREGDYYMFQGQKLFSSGADLADYGWAAARTDPTLPKHRGLSLFILDLKTPGVTVRPLISMAGDRRFNEVFIDGARIARRFLVGEENKGWQYLTVALDFERATAGAAGFIGHSISVLEELTDYVKANPALLRHKPALRSSLIQRVIDVEVLRVLSYRLLYLMASGRAPTYESSQVKLYGSEVTQRLAQTAGEILGLYGQLWRGSQWAPQDGRLLSFLLRAVSDSIRGGTSEIQRNIIAIRGLGLPTSR